MLGQALEMKSNIETRKAQNQIGHIIWQLNEIWPTGGWGSLEYGAPTYPGQVIGGRWKPLHYLLRASIFTDVAATCGKGGVCYVRNDRAGLPFHGTVVVTSVEIETGKSSTVGGVPASFDLVAGPAAVSWFTLDAVTDGTTHFLMVDCLDENGEVVSHNVLLQAPPKDIKTLPKDSGLGLKVASQPNADSSIDIAVTATAPVALYVTLTTAAHGRFSDNAFELIGGTKTIQFVPFGDLDAATLRKSLRVEDLAMYA